MSPARRAIAVCALVVVLGVCVVSPARSIVASAGSRFVELTNADRASVGLAGFDTASDLVEAAQAQADRMAAEHRIFHNPNLAIELVDWQAIGENVGSGRSPSTLHQAFMASPDHRAHLLSTNFSEMGVGTAVGDDGLLYVSEVFRARTEALAPVEPSARPIASGAPVSASASDAVAAPAPPTSLPTSTNTTTPTPRAAPVGHSAVALKQRSTVIASPVQARSAQPMSATAWVAAALAAGVLLGHASVMRGAHRVRLAES